MKKYRVALSKEKGSGCFTATNSDHYSLCLNGLHDEDKGKGISPMEMMLTAAGGCAGIDIVGMLKSEGEELRAFDIIVEGFRNPEETPAYFRKVNFYFSVEGDVCKEKIIRCTELSLEKYCTVGKTLEAYATVDWSLTLNGVQEFEHVTNKSIKTTV